MKKMMMKSKGMARGGRMKSKGMARGGKAMKSKGYAKGGAVGGKKKKAAKKPTMSLASIRAAAKKKGYKLVKA
jgi:hypothetical protein|tara:strand:- start:73 stop:291 length:219 start_codon:yes stop_codon:yes gene_type:complete